MTQAEFTYRTGVEVSASVYAEIENDYMRSPHDKDEYCRIWLLNHPQPRDIKPILPDNTYQTAKRVSSELMRIAEMYQYVMGSDLISTDMQAYCRGVKQTEFVMRSNKHYYDYTMTLYVRAQGVESDKDRADYFGRRLANITISYNASDRLYTIEVVKVFNFSQLAR